MPVDGEAVTGDAPGIEGVDDSREQVPEFVGKLHPVGSDALGKEAERLGARTGILGGETS